LIRGGLKNFEFSNLHLYRLELDLLLFAG
jgi:hypothetical protein